MKLVSLRHSEWEIAVIWPLIMTNCKSGDKSYLSLKLQGVLIGWFGISPGEFRFFIFELENLLWHLGTDKTFKKEHSLVFSYQDILPYKGKYHQRSYENAHVHKVHSMSVNAMSSPRGYIQWWKGHSPKIHPWEIPQAYDILYTIIFIWTLVY